MVKLAKLMLSLNMQRVHKFIDILVKMSKFSFICFKRICAKNKTPDVPSKFLINSKDNVNYILVLVSTYIFIKINKK